MAAAGKLVHNLGTKFAIMCEYAAYRGIIPDQSLFSLALAVRYSYQAFNSAANRGTISAQMENRLARLLGFDTRDPRWVDPRIAPSQRAISPGEYRGRDNADAFRDYLYGLPDNSSAPEQIVADAELVANDTDTSQPSQDNLIGLANSIPDQNSVFRFTVSDQGRLRLVPSLNEENDYETIEALRAEMLDDFGPIAALERRYSQNPNTPQAGLLGPMISSYAQELSKDAKDINYAVLYARGARFYAARATSNRQIASGEWPEPDADEAEAIDTICALHGPLIMASAAGRQIVANAHEYETTPEMYRKEEVLIQEFGGVLAAETDIIEPESSKALFELTTPIENDPQPARSRGVRLLITGSALVAIVGGVAWLSSPAASASIVFTTATGMFFWEVVKKTEGFRQATDDLAAGFTTATKAVGEQATIQQLSLLRRMQHLVETKKSLFAKVAELRPEFGWATSVLNKETETGRFQEFNLLPVVGQAMSEASREFDAYPVIEHNHLGYTIPIVFGSEAQIRQVITELIRNAMLHSGGSAPITVSITQTEMDYRVAVRDEGQGIPNEYVPRLTEPGYKVPGTSGGGAGNGLSLVKRILTAHKARLLISSEPREGSAFTVCLPAVTRPSTFRASG